MLRDVPEKRLNLFYSQNTTLGERVTTVLEADQRAVIEQALIDQQSGIVDPYTLHQHAKPVPANPSVTGAFVIDEFIVDLNDRVAAGSSALARRGVLDAADSDGE